MRSLAKRYRHLPLLLVVALAMGQAQEADLLIVNGHVFDPKNQIDEPLDIAIHEGKVMAIGRGLPRQGAKKVIEAKGMFVCPGLIDMHTHVFVGGQPKKFANGSNSLSPDDFAPRSGVTTVVDAGTSGWRNFAQFKRQVIDISKTRVLAFLNIAGVGMTGDAQQEDLKEMHVSKAVECIREYPDLIVGVKIGHYTGSSWKPFDNAILAAERTDRPIFVECHLPQYPLQDQLTKMRPCDIITHSYEKVSERASVIGEDGYLRPVVKEAAARGVLFDLGHGGAGFWFSEAIPALRQGLAPNSFGTDLHRFSMNAGMKNMLNVMSKYVAMGMDIREALRRATWLPAQALGRADLGHLSMGAVADVAVLRLREGEFGFVDAGNNRIRGEQMLEAELTLRAGKVIWDLNGIGATPFKQP